MSSKSLMRVLNPQTKSTISWQELQELDTMSNASKVKLQDQLELSEPNGLQNKLKSRREEKKTAKVRKILDQNGREVKLVSAYYWTVKEHEAFVAVVREHGKDFKKI